MLFRSSGTNGATGTSGFSGFSGFSGTNGATGTSGFSGFSGTNGTIGADGASGFSGFSGSAGTADTAPTPNTIAQRDSTGNLFAVDFISSSDRRLKHDIQRIENAIETLQKIEGVAFKWNSTNEQSYGFIAQEIEKTMPELVKTSYNGVKSVSYVPLIAILLEAIKDQQRQIDELKNK